MSADPKVLKKQRDRFLAFAFASADLLLEIAEDGIISYALGAARSLTGIDHETLKGHKWLNLFSPNDRLTLLNMQKKARDAQRCGPFSVTLDEELGKGQEAIVTGIKMPDSEKFYITIGFPAITTQRIADNLRDDGVHELLDKNTFLSAAHSALDIGRSLGQDLDVTLLFIANSETLHNQIGDHTWSDFTDAVTQMLGAHSVDGQAIAEIAHGRYSIIHDKSITSEDLQSELKALILQNNPEAEADVSGKTVSADLQALSERETMKALIYTINEFERKGTSFNIETLNAGFQSYVSANAQKIHEFKTIIAQMNFDFEYMPIVNLDTYDVSHFEMLTVFKKGESTREWVTFGEDIGLATEFDMAVCERAINYLLYKSSGHSTKFSVNLSGHSLQNEQFFKTLLAKLGLHKELSHRLIFEITESTTIADIALVSHHITTLQEQGFKVCLDDFGTASPSLEYLQKLAVDYVKLDGQYTNKILTSERDAVLVKNLSRLCRDLDIVMIAERIETQAQADLLRSLNIPYGQGYLFGKPAHKPEYDSSRIKAA